MEKNYPMDTGDTLTVSGTGFDYFVYGNTVLRIPLKRWMGTKAPKAFGGKYGRNKNRSSCKRNDS